MCDAGCAEKDQDVAGYVPIFEVGPLMPEKRVSFSLGKIIQGSVDENDRMPDRATGMHIRVGCARPLIELNSCVGTEHLGG